MSYITSLIDLRNGTQNERHIVIIKPKGYFLTLKAQVRYEAGAVSSSSPWWSALGCKGYYGCNLLNNWILLILNKISLKYKQTFHY